MQSSRLTCATEPIKFCHYLSCFMIGLNYYKPLELTHCIIKPHNFLCMVILIVFSFDCTVASLSELSFYYKLHFQTLCAVSVQFIRREKAGDKLEMPMPMCNFFIVKVSWKNFQSLAQFLLKSVRGFPFLSTRKETKLGAWSFKISLSSFFFFEYFTHTK